MRKWYRHVIAVRLFDKLMDDYHATPGDVDAILKEVAKLYREARAEIDKDGP